MGLTRDDAERLRRADAERERELARRDPAAAGGAACLVGVTVDGGSYPATASAFYKVRVLRVGGTESEGSAGVTSTTSPVRYVFAANLGTAVPPIGTPVICRRVPHRWVFRYDS